MRTPLRLLLLLTLTAACGRGAGSETPDAAVEAPLLSATVRGDGRTVVLTAGADPCSTVTRTDVEQNATEVVVAVYLRGPETVGPGCDAMTAASYEVPITLDEPLGERVIRARGGGTVVTRREAGG